MTGFLKRFWPYILIISIVLVFFYPIFKGQVPFPGDLLVNENPYISESFLGYSPGGYPNKAQGPDIINEIYPWRYFSVEEVLKGNVPFWNPHNFSGNPQMANLQTAVFYPINIFYFFLPFNVSWTLIILLQHFLAGIFMFLFLRRSLSLKEFPSFIGGIAFAFSSSMIVWLEYGNIGHTFLLLPLAMFFVNSLYKKQNVFNYVFLVLTLSFSILAGYIQMAFYIFILSFFYFLFLFRREELKLKVKRLFVFLTAFIFPVFLTAFQLLPTYKIFSVSTRGAYSLSQIENNLLPIKYWITVFVPDFFGNPATRNYFIDGTYIERTMYVGVIILFFAIFAAFKAKNSSKTFFIAAATITLFLTTNLPFVKYFYLLPIPVITTTVATRALILFIFSTIVLSAIGIDHWFYKKHDKCFLPIVFSALYALFLIIVTFIPSVFGIGAENIRVSQRNLILPILFSFSIIFIFFLKNKLKKIVLILLTLVLLFDLFYFFNKITPFSPKELIYPKTPVVSFLKENAGIDRFWGYGSGYIPPNFQSVDGTYSPEGNDPLHIKEYGELLASTKNGKIPDVLPRPDANIAPGFGDSDLKNNYFRKRVLDLLGVKYILNKNDNIQGPDLSTFSKEEYSLVWEKTPWQIYENKNALPRFFMANSFVLAKNKNEVLSLIYDKNIDLRKTLILEEKPEIKIDKVLDSNVKLISYNSNEVIFETEAAGSSMLFLSDNFYPEWEAKIDGKIVKIQVADYSFRALSVPKGEHIVEFIYNPRSFMLGLKIALFGLLLLIGFLFFLNKYENKS
jgi:hypothetical protein